MAVAVFPLFFGRDRCRLCANVRSLSCHHPENLKDRVGRHIVTSVRFAAEDACLLLLGHGHLRKRLPETTAAKASCAKVDTNLGTRSRRLFGTLSYWVGWKGLSLWFNPDRPRHEGGRFLLQRNQIQLELQLGGRCQLPRSTETV